MDLKQIRALGVSTIPAHASEPVADFSEKALAEDASDDIDKAEQPVDKKAAKSSKLQEKRRLLQVSATMADQLGEETLAKIGRALMK